MRNLPSTKDYNMKNTVVTICIPAYNCEGFIEHAISALKKQTTSRWKAEISLDVSSDNSAQLCRELVNDDARFRLITQDRRLGWIDNINYLLKGIDTDYYMIHPHDDYLSNNYIKLLLEHLDKNPSVNSAVGKLKYTKNNRELDVSGNKTGSTFERLRDYLLEPRNGLLFRAIVRKKPNDPIHLLRTHSYESKGVDLVWVMELLMQGDAVILPEAIYWKKSRKEGLTGKWGKWPLNLRIACVAEYLSMMVEIVNDSEALNSYEKNELFALLFFHFQRYMIKSPKYFGGDPLSEASKLKLSAVLWTRICINNVVSPEAVDRLIDSSSIHAISNEIEQILNQQCHQTNARSAPNSNLADRPKNYIKSSTDNLSGDILDRGDTAVANGNIKLAREQYLSVASLSDGDPNTLHIVSKRLQTAHLIEDSTLIAERAKNLEPNSARRWVRVGALYLKQKKYDKAEHEFQTAVDLDDSYASAYYHMALLYESRDLLNEAVVELRKAIKFRPDITNYQTMLNRLSADAA